MSATENTPFVGASVCYTRAYKLLKWMGEKGGYVKQIKNRKGVTIRCEVDEEMQTLVDALNKGNEETIKYYLSNPRFIDIVHAK